MPDKIDADSARARLEAELEAAKPGDRIDESSVNGGDDCQTAQRRLNAYIRTYSAERQRIADLMDWCASYLGNSLIHRKIRELLAIPEAAYPWQTDTPPGRPDTREELQARVEELCEHLDETVGALSVEQLHRLFRATRLYGCGFLLKHGSAQLELNPADVTIVWPAAQETTELEMRSRISVLEERIREVRERCEQTSSSYRDTAWELAQELLPLLDGEDEEAR